MAQGNAEARANLCITKPVGREVSRRDAEPLGERRGDGTAAYCVCFNYPTETCNLRHLENVVAEMVDGRADPGEIILLAGIYVSALPLAELSKQNLQSKVAGIQGGLGPDNAYYCVQGFTNKTAMALTRALIDQINVLPDKK